MDDAQLQSMVLMLILWVWCFLLAPARAYRAGVIIEDPPIGLKMRGFLIAKIFFLLAMLGFGYLVPTSRDLLTVDPVAAFADIGPLIGMGLTILMLWLIPLAVAKSKTAKEEDPGCWGAPSLVFFRWVWFGIVVFFCTGYCEMIGIPEPLDPIVGSVLAVAGALIYTLWWGLPSASVARKAADGDPRATEALRNVRWSGLTSFIVYKSGGSMRHGGRGKDGDEPRKLCTSCMRPIDDLEAYEALNFTLCPHCGEVIPPVFTVVDYVKALARKFEDEINAKASGKKGKKEKKASKADSELTQRILRGIMTMTVRERGTDLHIGGEGDSTVVRCRTDGVLFPMLELPEPLLKNLVSAIKVQSNLDITERRRPQDGSFKTIVDEKTLDVRVNTSPSAQGETLSLRLLYRQKILGSLEHLGMSVRNYRLLNELITRPHGLILVTGPTGSGKTTTLYNSLGSIADGRKNIVTLEDPIEFKIDGLNQMQIDSNKGFTFVNGLRTILRQDPDVIMVGEIRDAETAKMAIDAANTGHLVLSTLHTIDTAATLGRLTDLEIDAHRHADALLAIVAQRLVRLNCARCLEDVELTREELSALNLDGGPEKLKLKRGVGCDRCHHTGYFEREGIYEIFIPDAAVRKLISDKAHIADIRRVARMRGMRTLLEDGMVKAVLGRTTVEEVLRVTH